MFFVHGGARFADLSNVQNPYDPYDWFLGSLIMVYETPYITG